MLRRKELRFDLALWCFMLLATSAVSMCIGWAMHEYTTVRPMPPSGLTATQWRCIESMPGSADCRVLERVK